MAKPIFVIGNNRSGTKWISNLLLGHPDIAGIQSPNHKGILETGLLTAFLEIFGSLTNSDSRIGCIECFAATDYFRLTGFDKDVLYRLPVGNYYEFFRALMDRLADERGAGWWLQKFSPIALPGLMRHFSDARYVMITRGVTPTIRSNMIMAGDPPRWRSAIRHLYWYHYGKDRAMALRGTGIGFHSDHVRDPVSTEPQRRLRRYVKLVSTAHSMPVSPTHPNALMGVSRNSSMPSVIQTATKSIPSNHLFHRGRPAGPDGRGRQRRGANCLGE
jgi:hypothetical protein